MTVKQELAASVVTDLLFEEPGVGRCLVAPDGTVLRANAEWLRSTGFSLDDVLGADLVELFPETRDLALALHAWARAGHRVEVPRHVQRLQGRDTWWEGSIAPVPMEGGTGLLVTAREVSRQHAAGARDDLAGRSRTAEGPSDADQRMRELIAVLSHELRNPLAPIRNGIRVIERAAPGSDAARRAVEILRRQAERLARLVDDLPALARITHARFERAAPPPAAAGSARDEEPGTGLSVLIVDDNEDAAATLADLLALGGHRVATASSGRAGLEAIEAHGPPDVLICDVGLTDMSGHDVIRSVRARLPRGAPFAVALTGFAQPEDREAALAAGFDAHLPKPPPLEELDGLLEEAARRKRG